MDSNFLNTAPRLLGLALGIALAALTLLAARPSAHDPRLPASVTVGVPPTGELDVSPRFPQPVLRAPALTPGTVAHSSFVLRNQTPVPLALSLRGRPSSSELDALLRVRISAAGAELADTTVGGLRDGSSPTTIDPGEAQPLRLRVWLPAAVADGYQGRELELELEPVLEAVR